MAVGLYSFCFSGHAVFPTIYACMSDKRHFGAVLGTSFALVMFLYGAMAVLGFAMFGPTIKDQITVTILEEERGNIMSHVALWLVVVNPFAKFALTLFPVVTALELKLKSHYRSSALLTFLIRTLVVVGTFVIAVSVPFFSDLMALIGSVACLGIAVIIPCICHLKIFGYRCTSQYWVVWLVLLVGLLLSGVGTAQAAINIYNKYQVRLGTI